MPMIPTKPSVTAEDISEGESCSCRGCPIARAIARVLVPGVDVKVGPSVAALRSRDVVWELLLPSEAQRFIFRFDSGKPVEPLTFPLNVPSSLVP